LPNYLSVSVVQQMQPQAAAEFAVVGQLAVIKR